MFEAYKDRLPELWRRRAEHYYSEFARAEKGAELWRKGDLEGYGQLVFESGKSSIYNYECGCDELKKLYDQMHIRSDFRKWFPRMCQYGFIEGRDYEYMPRVRLQDEGGRTVQRYVKDYRITQDMAKKLCKLHHTAVGVTYHPQPFDWDVLLGLLHKKPPRRSSYEAQLSDSDSLVTTTQIAKEYGCGAKVFNRLLHLHGIQYRANGQWVLY